MGACAWQQATDTRGGYGHHRSSSSGTMAGDCAHKTGPLQCGSPMCAAYVDCDDGIKPRLSTGTACGTAVCQSRDQIQGRLRLYPMGTATGSARRSVRSSTTPEPAAPPPWARNDRDTVIQNWWYTLGQPIQRGWDQLSLRRMVATLHTAVSSPQAVLHKKRRNCINLAPQCSSPTAGPLQYVLCPQERVKRFVL